MAERHRLSEDAARTVNWKRWGPYLSERQWGTVREDYSADGSAWDYFTHDMARSRTYRWGEDGLCAIGDRECRLCFGLALWNGQDPILKERLFGLTGEEGNHGEDCKELYYYLDSTPTHSYMKMLYKYPQREYPYGDLVTENKQRGVLEREYEIEDTGVFDDGKYWDVTTEYCKGAANDIFIEINVANRGSDEASITVLPQLWFRNTWKFASVEEQLDEKPSIKFDSTNSYETDFLVVQATHRSLGSFALQAEKYGDMGADNILFTENETNPELFGEPRPDGQYFKDGFHKYVVNGDRDAVNPEKTGTKVGFLYNLKIGGGCEMVIRLRLFNVEDAANENVVCSCKSIELPTIQKDLKSLKSMLSVLDKTRPVDKSDTASSQEGVTERQDRLRSTVTPNKIENNKNRSLFTTRYGNSVESEYILDQSRVSASKAQQLFILASRNGAMIRGDGSKPAKFGKWFDDLFKQRKLEADEFYGSVIAKDLSADRRNVARQAFAGMLMSKQFFFYAVETWLKGDPGFPTPPASRLAGRNSEWKHLHNREVISMPDKWEYPWFASWDLAFHMIPFARIDADFAKAQLILFLREWYMSPSGQIPAYEWAFSDVNPPVHAWSCYNVFKITSKCDGNADHAFLARCFHKLLLNFTWWVNRKDPEGENLFSGGFLGLDNIGVFDRSKPLPTGGKLAQADGTSWMAFFCTSMLQIARELTKYDPSYEDMASKFFEHFIHIADAMQHGKVSLWDDEDGFYYDVLRINGESFPLKIRSMVGLIPLYACMVMEPEDVKAMPGFVKRTDWYLRHNPNVHDVMTIDSANANGGGAGVSRRLLSIANRTRLCRILKYLFDEDEFFGPYGIRSLSKVHENNPFILQVDGEEYRVGYNPAESESGMFGGNSNWRGPVWFPVNYLIIESLEKYYTFYGDSLKIEVPTRSGNMMNLKEAAAEISQRLSCIFLLNGQGNRPCHEGNRSYQQNESWKNLPLFYEYFHPESGRGIGASHQTGWTGLITECLER